MAVLIVGLILFLGTHSAGTLAPGLRSRVVPRIGEGPYKGLYSLISIAGFALIIIGFGEVHADNSSVYIPLPALRYLAAILMIPALVLVTASFLPPGHMKRAVVHPLLIGTILWALAHLFVNGDLAGVVLFGTFLMWAVVDLVLQPRRVPAPSPSAVRSDVLALVVGLGLYAVLIWRAHAWLFGVAPSF